MDNVLSEIHCSAVDFGCSLGVVNLGHEDSEIFCTLQSLTWRHKADHDQKTDLNRKTPTDRKN
jgi:hypothetical protein